MHHRRWNADGVQTSTTILKVVKGQEMTPDDVIKAHGYDPKQWKLVSNISNFWKQSEQTTSFQSKITVKPQHEIKPQEFAHIFNKEIKPLKITQHQSGRHNLVIPLFDLHFGIMTIVTMLIAHSMVIIFFCNLTEFFTRQFRQYGSKPSHSITQKRDKRC